MSIFDSAKIFLKIDKAIANKYIAVNVDTKELICQKLALLNHT